jgi:hypothetical protein
MVMVIIMEILVSLLEEINMVVILEGTVVIQDTQVETVGTLEEMVVILEATADIAVEMEAVVETLEVVVMNIKFLLNVFCQFFDLKILFVSVPVCFEHSQ